MASKPDPAGPLLGSVPSTKMDAPVDVLNVPQGLADPLKAVTTVVPFFETEWHASHVIAGVTFVGICRNCEGPCPTGIFTTVPRSISQ